MIQDSTRRIKPYQIQYMMHAVRYKVQDTRYVIPDTRYQMRMAGRSSLECDKYGRSAGSTKLFWRSTVTCVRESLAETSHCDEEEKRGRGKSKVTQ